MGTSRGQNSNVRWGGGNCCHRDLCKKFQSGRSCKVCIFFPDWDKGEPIYSDFKTVPGDGVDGYARDYVAVDENFFTKAPKKKTHLES